MCHPEPLSCNDLAPIKTKLKLLVSVYTLLVQQFQAQTATRILLHNYEICTAVTKVFFNNKALLDTFLKVHTP